MTCHPFGQGRGRGIYCTPDAIAQTIQVRGKTVYFDFGSYGGPLVTDKHGTPLARQPIRPNDPFWPPFNAWMKKWRAENPPPKAREHPSAYLDRRP